MYMTLHIEANPPTIDPELTAGGQVYFLALLTGYLFETHVIQHLREQTTRLLTRLYAVSAPALLLTALDLIRTDTIHYYDFVPSALLTLGIVAAHQKNKSQN